MRDAHAWTHRKASSIDVHYRAACGKTYDAQMSGTAERGVSEAIFPTPGATQGGCNAPASESASQRLADKRLSGEGACQS
ncbi:MAG: hypothetical protein LBU32_19760 [Clostridiales bacterium]|jgi:hypothetical protein|nr:hypothetical protein [Clostridiales bacterium]